jgi:hypothetical protein
MAAVRDRPVQSYYYELCKCHPHPLCRRPPAFGIPAFIADSDNDYALCLVVEAGLVTMLRSRIQGNGNLQLD